MNKKELLNKKMDILKKALENINNSSNVFENVSVSEPDLVDKRLNPQKETSESNKGSKSL